MACRQIQTVGRNRIIEDPIFEAARQTLNQAIEDYKRMQCNLGLPVNLWMINMSQALSTVGTYQIQQMQQQSPFAGPLSVKMVEDTMTFRPDCFVIIMDVQGFRPEDISITLRDNIVEISAERHIQDLNTAQCFSFHRRYTLPQNIRTDALESNLSCDGVLVLSAPWVT
ncbi:hypothetical protein L9F63_000014 [Diploptera punctata]|uniref:SHSP domain-containing protein n=1 Tax=Diploptera punctata TaxID=6984 RepID=A0AAD8AP55_DIPPU|nr:hypothetical protein L9F63_000014 [Diploptera punctata]